MEEINEQKDIQTSHIPEKDPSNEILYFSINQDSK
jgi:hypothetical protein